MRQNTTATTVTWADIDTGAEAASTTYYVYAVADADATTATFMISANSSTPTGATYYKRIGSFYNDSSSNITMGAIYAAAYGTVFANSSGKAPGTFGDWESKSSGTSYQATTDGFFVGSVTGEDSYKFSIYTDSASTPTTVRQYIGWTSITTACSISFCCPVKKGDYYRIVRSGSGDIGTLDYAFFIPLGI